MKNDVETPEGLRILYDLLIKASEYPGESPYTPRNLYSWGEKLKSLHQLLSPYHDEEYNREYRLIQKQILDVSREFPSYRYTHESYDLLFEWLGSISRLYGRLGLMIPENLTYTEGGEEGI
jgi:hypothetical protein